MAYRSALPGVAAVLLLASTAQPVQAQVIHLEQAPVPSPWTLSTRHFFYVYGEDDPATSANSAKGAQASVEFRQLAVSRSSLPSDYFGLEAALLPFDSFWDLVNEDSFCGSVSEGTKRKCCGLVLQKTAGVSFEELGVWTQKIPVGEEPQTMSFPLKHSGKYVLAISNCGNHSEARLSGSVAVRSVHGYLPAFEVNVLRSAGWAALGYIVIFLVWMTAVVRYYDTLIYIQKGLSLITLVCILETFCTWLDRQQWNATGERHDSLIVASTFFYSLKYVSSWWMMVTALGAGVTYTVPETSTQIVFYVCSLAFAYQCFTWRRIVSLRFSLILDKYLLVLLISGYIIFTWMCGWLFSRISRSTMLIREQKQEELAGIFVKVLIILAFAFCLSLVNATLQILDIGMNYFPWELAWLSADGAPQLSFMLVLVALMVVWRPTDQAWTYGYQMQENAVEGESGEEAEAVCNSVAPEPIGAPEPRDRLEAPPA